MTTLKHVLSFCFAAVFFAAVSQEKIVSTNSITVTGAVEKEMTFQIADLNGFVSKRIPDVVITNHLGEPRGTARGLKAILIKDVLSQISFKAESPKVLSEFFLTFVASDGYAAVYSWNEIFNSPTGDNIFLITEKDGKPLAEMSERILIITPTDFKTGRRHIKGLSKIVVGRIQKN
jgi:hypothetical protein